jgi:hypothetical protein
VIWGTIAHTIGIPITLSVASLALAATIIARKRYSTTLVDDLDFTPAGSDYWSLPPQLPVDTTSSEGQVLITIEYKVDPELSEEFEHNMSELGRTLKSEGMAYWELFQDPADIGHYLEIRIADTWTDHMRQHERQKI